MIKIENVEFYGSTDWLIKSQSDRVPLLYGVVEKEWLSKIEKNPLFSTLMTASQSSRMPFFAILKTAKRKVLITSFCSPGVYVWCAPTGEVVLSETMESVARVAAQRGVRLTMNPLAINYLFNELLDDFQAGPTYFREVMHVPGRMVVDLDARTAKPWSFVRKNWNSLIANSQIRHADLMFRLQAGRQFDDFVAEMNGWSKVAAEIARAKQAHMAVLLSGGVDSALVSWFWKTHSNETRIVTGYTEDAALSNGNEESYHESLGVASALKIDREAVPVNHRNPGSNVRAALDGKGTKFGRLKYGFMEGLFAALPNDRLLFTDGTNGDAQYVPEFLYRVWREPTVTRRILIFLLALAASIFPAVAQRYTNKLSVNHIGTAAFFRRHIEGNPGALYRLLVQIAAAGTIYRIQHAYFKGQKLPIIDDRLLAVMNESGLASDRAEVEDFVVRSVLEPIFGSRLLNRFKMESIGLHEYAVAILELHHFTWLARNVGYIHEIAVSVNPRARYINMTTPEIARIFKAPTPIATQLFGKPIYYRLFRRLTGATWLSVSAKSRLTLKRQDVRSSKVEEYFAQCPLVVNIIEQLKKSSTEEISNHISDPLLPFAARHVEMWSAEALQTKKGFVRATWADRFWMLLEIQKKLSGRSTKEQITP